MSSVIVLTPNARRQTVKVTPNTTLLKVLEEACTKHGFNPEEYDLKHYNKIMDLTVPIRFSGLPNNALLEMVPVKKRRQEVHVTVALQLEEKRFTEDFMPSDSLWTIIEKICPVDVRNLPKVPVVVYMHREIVGIECLSKTLLKDLGLTSGRAVLRLAFRESEETPELKATGSGLYIHPQLPVMEEPGPVQTGKEGNLKHSEQQEQLHESNKNKTVTTVPPADKTDKTAVNTGNVATPHIVSSEHSSNDSVLQPVQKDNEQQYKPIVGDKQLSQQNFDDTSDHAQEQSIQTVDSNQHMETIKGTCSETELDRYSSENMEIDNIEYIGERNALVFNPVSEGPAMEVNLPDDFFNITVDDVRYLMRDMRRLREDIENQPLSTSATKELNTSTKTLSLLHSYKHTVIRVQFPNRLVLQAIFSPLDTVETVMDFVKQFLEQPDLQFYLYSTPPKLILEREQRLVEADCVPRALLYFGVGQSSVTTCQQQKYLKSSLLSSVTTQKQASAAALQVRRLDRNESRDRTDDDNVSSSLLTVSNKIPAQDQNQRKSNESVYNEPGTSGIQQNASGPTVNKMPKWFKPL